MTVNCATCSKPIEGKVLNALGKSYHPEHFVCAQCNKPITGSQFQEKDGKPYCPKDFEQFLPKCASCGKPVVGKVIKALDKDWHEEHFVCSQCKAKLAGTNFFVENGQPICEKCKQKTAPKCKSCGKPVAEQVVMALDAHWHPECFVCVKCKKPVTEEFTVENGYPVCKTCSNKK